MNRSGKFFFATAAIIAGVGLHSTAGFSFTSTPPRQRQFQSDSPTEQLEISRRRNQRTFVTQGLPDSHYQQGNLTFDLSHVYDANLKDQILSSLKLGFRAAASGGKSIQAEIANLRGDGNPRTIQFFSDPKEADPGAIMMAETAFAVWNVAPGASVWSVRPSARTGLRVFFSPKQPYYGYLVNSVWHELLHLTLSTTHGQTTTDGSVSEAVVDNVIWYQTIKQIMLNFPKTSVDPVTGESVEIYNVENSPWS